MKQAVELPREQLRADDLAGRLARPALLVGGAAGVVSVVLGFMSGWQQFFRSYLLGYCFFLSLALGALFFVLLHHLTRAGWSVVVRRLAEMMTGIFPLLAVLLLPILVFPGQLYEWVHPPHDDHLLAHKAPYLNLPFFLIRCVIYFVVWLGLSHYYFRKSVEQDTTGDERLTLQMQKMSAPGMVLFALTLTFASVDLLMSLEANFFSTIFGVYFFSGSALVFFATLALLVIWLQSQGRLVSAITTEHQHDIGKLCFAFTVFWAYIAFSQYMLIWYANLPEETFWFEMRQEGGWATVSLALLFGHFFVPFFLLMSRWTKRRRSTLALLAAWVILMHLLDLFWLIMPGSGDPHAAGVRVHALDLTCLVAIGGLCVWQFANRLRGRSLLAERDPRLAESLAFHNY